MAPPRIGYRFHCDFCQIEINRWIAEPSFRDSPTPEAQATITILTGIMSQHIAEIHPGYRWDDLDNLGKIGITPLSYRK